ncbi:RagB/SusD family nutrient uptake outer membrane protein [Sphingobacterium olei]|uniref:RagB/SusD family nutrient uptake outer membrane protein n=1 Tax=Sphingobacterium olei TaxID=2571155 RepID=A0A4U0PJH2_9SPHI|nr:RagB/SusD family nutrient uptake outer membrane protein [Sphingobacterium olei]TJZ63044.1 RagB/SusD family nutrient uptake outer membrane protein [Sphingobacterium olei]
MKKISLIFISAISTISVYTSCNKWLDVQPNSQIRDSELFETEQGFKEALAGVYTILGNQSLYGGQLTYQMMGVLSKEWSNYSGLNYDDMANYDYVATLPQQYIENVWSNMYQAVSNTNNILAKIDQYPVFRGDNYAIIKGEALALRAFIHFDLLRCFGANYMVSPNQPAIPYVTRYTSKQTNQSTVSETITQILDDLIEAKKLLEKDPIFTGRVVTQLDDNGYLINRQVHLNYYAVEGLLARIYLYIGQYDNAYASAKSVIDGNKFSFTTQANASSQTDLVGASEHLFALNIFDLAQRSQMFLEYGTDGIKFNLTQTQRLNYFDNDTDDYRYLYLFEGGAGADANNRYLLKYSESTSDDIYYQSKMPIIKLAEMYYILAEYANHTQTDALPYFNAVRRARGISELSTAPVDFRAFMTTEFRKEFIGEGQFFYYYKRLNQQAILNGSHDMVAEKAYIFPLPDSEYEAANRVSNR